MFEHLPSEFLNWAAIGELVDVAVAGLESVTLNIGKVHLNLYLVLKALLAFIALQWGAGFAVRRVDARLGRLQRLRASDRALIVKMFQIFLYCLVFLFAMQALGISLAALGVFGGALGVGLGFGLQKISSNFISGIILLFEKSIEIGDMVELADGTTGFVRQTYARYTRLEMTSGKEVLIPNEEFITQRVISWTHTNTTAQVEIVAHISYGSDSEHARRLMLACADGYSGKLKGSESLCFITNFGDNGIELRLQFWIPDVRDGRMKPKSDVMALILQRFQTEGIEIPYPQRQVRVLNDGVLA